MSDLLRNVGLRLIDRKYRRLLTAFAMLDNQPTLEKDVCAVYSADLKTLRDDIKSYAHTCERHEIGGHGESTFGCEQRGKHRVCSISLNARQKLLWLDQEFADEAFEKECVEYFDPVAIADRLRADLALKRNNI